MIVIKSAEEIEKIRKASQVVVEVLNMLEEIIIAGVTTFELDRRTEELLRKRGVQSAFKGYRGYPATICTSVNEVVVHGIPSRTQELKEGDIIGIDCGVISDGFYGDAARTFPVGKVDQESERLLKTAREALKRGEEQIREGNRLYDISAAIQSCAEGAGYNVVRDYVGHGIGRALHEEPQVPNFGKAGTGPRLSTGMVIAIEPMLNIGTSDVELLGDGWTVATKDRKRSAHFENTIAVTSKGPEVLSRI